MRTTTSYAALLRQSWVSGMAGYSRNVVLFLFFFWSMHNPSSLWVHPHTWELTGEVSALLWRGRQVRAAWLQLSQCRWGFVPLQVQQHLHDQWSPSKTPWSNLKCVCVQIQVSSKLSSKPPQTAWRLQPSALPSCTETNGKLHGFRRRKIARAPLAAINK